MSDKQWIISDITRSPVAHGHPAFFLADSGNPSGWSSGMPWRGSTKHVSASGPGEGGGVVSSAPFLLGDSTWEHRAGRTLQSQAAEI